ncbi:MAG TPA: phosphatase PAP2 family protein, partial [Jatrophihabitantaceae bacterium]|nr:phosphatase PAP2 family protein [Jatrophihabitantaceae bacterium]
CRAATYPRLQAIAPFARESGYVAGLYALWQLAATVSLLGTSGAFAKARWIVRVERDWHLPSELDTQRLVVPHPLLAQACNLYYATMHFAGLGALLLWLFLRHRDRYPQVRTTIVLLTASCLLVQLVPVAPPRLLPNFGFVDTAEQYGQSVYTALKAVGPDQLSAMPSVHVGWAVLVGAVVVWLGTSRWRWLALLHPALTIFVVAATANHFWLDGIVAVALLVLAVAVQWTGRALATAVAARLAAGMAVPEPEAVAISD